MTIPIDPLWSTDPGHEGGLQPMKNLKGTCGTPNVAQPIQGDNTGAAQPGPTATDAQSPDSGFMGGSVQTYSGGAA